MPQDGPERRPDEASPRARRVSRVSLSNPDASNLRADRRTSLRRTWIPDDSAGCSHDAGRQSLRSSVRQRGRSGRAHDIVGGGISRLAVRITLASCWVLNPVQVQLHVADRPLGQAPQRIAMRYSRCRHTRMPSHPYFIAVTRQASRSRLAVGWQHRSCSDQLKYRARRSTYR